jgi:cbb3-type cytochrome oxidase maturation protein
MEVLYLLVPLSVAIVFFAVWIFLRMSGSGQFDDMEGPAYRILLDDDDPTLQVKEKPAQQPEQRHD